MKQNNKISLSYYNTVANLEKLLHFNNLIKKGRLLVRITKVCVEIAFYKPL